MIETIRTILDRPFYYDLFNIVIGANHLRNVLVNEYIRPTSSDQILDVGCGSGNMVPFLLKANISVLMQTPPTSLPRDSVTSIVESSSAIM